MGRSARPRPKRLPDKLLRIRERLGLSQNEMLTRLGLKEKLLRAAVPTPMMFCRAQCAVWYCVRSFFSDQVSAIELW